MRAGEPDPAGDVRSPAVGEDIRPLVAVPRSNRGVWLFAAGLALVALLLFQALEARRSGITAPSTVAPADSSQRSVGSPPELVLPPQPLAEAPQYPSWPQPVMLRPVASPDATGQAPPRVTRMPPALSPYQPPAVPPPSSSAFRDAYSPPSAPGAGWTPGGQRPGAPEAPGGASGKDRVQASRFANPATTVPKGTVIQAVLESALDSTRGGFARGIVSRDIYGFDGSRVLIQRGSRIIGEYKSDVSRGQSRILIQWQRLMRPDGVMIDLDSPSADPLGRAGVKGSVNTHFFERFGGAILQSTLDLGVQLAARAASHDTVVLALPGSLQQSTQVVQPDKIAPTVKVRQGSSVSVFVAKDLDFTDVDK